MNVQSGEIFLLSEYIHLRFRYKLKFPVLRHRTKTFKCQCDSVPVSDLIIRFQRHPGQNLRASIIMYTMIYEHPEKNGNVGCVDLF